MDLLDVHCPPQAAALASPALCLVQGCTETEELSQLSEDWFNTSTNLISIWSLQNMFPFPIKKMTTFAYETFWG